MCNDRVTANCGGALGDRIKFKNKNIIIKLQLKNETYDKLYL